MKFMKLAIPAALLMFAASEATLAATTASFTKTAAPRVVLVTTGGVGSAAFFASSTDFPAGTLSKPKTLLGINWQTTLYPNNPNESVDLCYFRPYAGTPVACVPINRNSSGTALNFNNEPFGLGVEVMIRHWTNGGPQPAYPAGRDTVTITYSY